MTTVPESAPSAAPAAAPDRHYLILGIVHNADDPAHSTMEVLFYEDGHTARYNLWLPDDPSKVDAEIKARWPIVEIMAKKAAAANITAKIDAYKSLLATKTSVTGAVGPVAPPTPAAPPKSLGVQKPAS